MMLVCGILQTVLCYTRYDAGVSLSRLLCYTRYDAGVWNSLDSAVLHFDCLPSSSSLNSCGVHYRDIHIINK